MSPVISHLWVGGIGRGSAGVHSLTALEWVEVWSLKFSEAPLAVGE